MGAAEALAAHFTYADYRTWPATERWELIEGVAYAMAAPSRLHQLVSFEVGFQIRTYLTGKPCSIYAAPFDIRLPRRHEADDAVDTIVQPDLAVICDKSKLDDKGCRGAPDWVVEVLSPKTALIDLDKKRRLYEQHGIKEYWIIHPLDRWVMIYTLDAEGRYGHPRLTGMDEATQASLFPELSIEWGFMQEEP